MGELRVKTRSSASLKNLDKVDDCLDCFALTEKESLVRGLRVPNAVGVLWLQMWLFRILNYASVLRLRGVR